jgi:hypothetical protein
MRISLSKQSTLEQDWMPELAWARSEFVYTRSFPPKYRRLTSTVMQGMPSNTPLLFDIFLSRDMLSDSSEPT